MPRKPKTKFSVLLKFFGIYCIILILVKMFTVVIIFRDDPVTMLAVRLVPAFSNKEVVENYGREYGLLYKIILIKDENGFIGEEIYFFTVNFLCIFSVVIWLIMLAVYLASGKISRNRYS